MPDLDSGQDRLRIANFVLDYVVHGSPARALSAQGRLNRILQDKLSATIGDALGRLPAGRDGIWLVRKLNVDLDVDLEFADGEIAKRWAHRLGRSLARKLQDGGSDQVRFFPDRQAMLGRFLVDLAKGCAWSAWYYREFDGLKALPTSAALRTALLDDPDLGLNSLAGLTGEDRARILDALGAGEARRVFDGLAEAAGEGKLDANAFSLLVEGCSHDSAVPLSTAMQPWAEALGLYVEIFRGYPAAAGTRLADVCVAATVLRLLPRTESHGWIEAVAEALTLGDVAALGRSLSPDVANPLLRLEADQRNELVSAAFGDSAAARSRSGAAARFTTFGGVFLLLPFLARLPLAEAVAGWPEPAIGEKLAALRLLLLAQATGANRALAAFRDPLLRDLAGVLPGLTPELTLEWLGNVTPGQLLEARRCLAHSCIELRNASFRGDLEFLELPSALRPTNDTRWFLTCAAQYLLRTFARRLPGFASSSLAHLQNNFLAMNAAVEPEAERWLVRLNRPPLNVILAMTGLVRCRYRLPWWDERPLELYQEP